MVRCYANPQTCVAGDMCNRMRIICRQQVIFVSIMAQWECDARNRTRTAVRSRSRWALHAASPGRALRRSHIAVGDCNRHYLIAQFCVS